MTATLVTTGSAQRRYSATPATGTLTTGTVPAWVTLTSYVLDPTDGGINRVTNNGNLYQCKTAGVSGVTGPTTTSADITDGTAHWTYLGPAHAATNILSGDLVIVTTARGVQAAASPTAPTNNDSRAVTVGELHAYAGFPDSSCGTYRLGTGTNKTGITSSVSWGDIGGGSGDEITNTWVAFRGVLVGAPHATGQVERANATSGVCTGPSITTTVPCLVISWWFGNGNVITTGTDHTATPGGSLTLVPGATCLKSLSANGYIQQACAYRVVNTPGTFAETWTTGAGSSEGGQIVTIAFALDTIDAVIAATLGDVTMAVAAAVEVSTTVAATIGDLTMNVQATVDAVPGGVGGVGLLTGLICGVKCGL